MKERLMSWTQVSRASVSSEAKIKQQFQMALWFGGFCFGNCPLSSRRKHLQSQMLSSLQLPQ